MAFNSPWRKQVLARHTYVHKDYISSGRVKLLQEFRVIASFATHRDVRLGLEQYTDGTANGCRIVGKQNAGRYAHI